MTQKTRATLKSDANASFADNTSGDITPAVLRGEIAHIADSAWMSEDFGVGDALLMTAAERAKLLGVEPNATADQTAAEIETAYNAQVPVASQSEAEAGTETAIRRFNPLRIAQAIAALAPSAGGTSVTALGEKTTPIDADLGVIYDSADATAFTAKKLTFANLYTWVVSKFLTGGGLGAVTTGTITLAQSNGSFQNLTNGGAFTLAPPASGNCNICLQVTNNASAGTITTTGFTQVVGDTITTTDGDDFMFYVTKIGTFSVLNVVALQ